MGWFGKGKNKVDSFISMYRFYSDCNSTLGVLNVNGLTVFTCEDEYRECKIKGETRIPAGRYKVELRNEGGMTKKYAERYGDMHKGMLWLKDVPGFEYVYIHTGNNEGHTEGCILVGLGSNVASQCVTESRMAYRDIYPVIADKILLGDDVYIEIR